MNETTVPQARRLHPPGWRDPRLLVGLVLVLLSVLGGLALVRALDERVPVYAASRPLLPGQEVTDDDVVPVPVQVDGAISRYVDATRPLAPGTVVLRQVGEGELVPAAALGRAEQAGEKVVTVPVDPAAAASLAVGDVVDVWVSPREDAAGGGYRPAELLLEQAVVASVPETDGGLGMGVSRSAVQVVVPQEQVGALIASVDQEARVTLVAAPGSAGR